jgi:hypothetical protein
MTTVDFDALRHDANVRYKAAVRAARDDYKRDIEAISRISRMTASAKDAQHPVDPPAPTSPAVDPDPRDMEPKRLRELGALVENAVGRLSGQFDAKRIEDEIRRADKFLNGNLQRRSIASALARMVEANRLRVVRVGRGRRSTKYVKT